MDKRVDYHKSILARYVDELPKDISVDAVTVGADNCVLSATETHSDSSIGVIIVPGITVPRESYYRLLIALSNFNSLVFDLRGQSFSKGKLDARDCIRDINIVGKEFRKRRNLEFLVGIGHSYGGLGLLLSSLLEDHPYDLRISLAAPVDMTKTSGKIPEKWSALFLYFHNLYRVLTNPANRDLIVREYQHIWPLAFLKDPRIVSLKAKDPHDFNEVRLQTPRLTDKIMGVDTPTSLIYAGSNERLGINGKLTDDYEELHRLALKKRFEFTLIKGLSHRFNVGEEKEFVLSYNNNMAIDKIREIMEIHIS